MQKRMLGRPPDIRRWLLAEIAEPRPRAAVDSPRNDRRDGRGRRCSSDSWRAVESIASLLWRIGAAENRSVAETAWTHACGGRSVRCSDSPGCCGPSDTAGQSQPESGRQETGKSICRVRNGPCLLEERLASGSKRNRPQVLAAAGPSRSCGTTIRVEDASSERSALAGSSRASGVRRCWRPLPRSACRPGTRTGTSGWRPRPQRG